MKFMDEISTDTLIISNKNIKEIYFNMGILKPVKFMTMNEFLSKYYFSYDESTISYVVNKYNIKYDIAKEYLDNLYYVQDRSYGVSKLDFLVSLKYELNNNKLLIHNDLFKEYLKRVKIIIYDIASIFFIPIPQILNNLI